MERAFITARPRNKQYRRVFKVVGLSLILGCLIGFSLISTYSEKGYITPKARDEAIIQNRLLEGNAASFDFSHYDNSKCDDGLPEGYEFTIEEKCRFFTESCPTDRLIDYNKFRYCTIGDNTVGAVFGIALLVVWLLVLFYMLSQAAESHFCPMLSEISSALRMSPDLAGMSILAFGNGAPDVFSSIAAFQQNDVGVLIGEMTGAGAFITHVIVGAIGVTATVTLRPYSFLRDILCYIAGLAFVLALLIDKKLYLWEAIAFLVFYFCYLGVAIVIHVVEVKKGKASVVGDKNKEKEKRPLLQNDSSISLVIQAGEATLADPDYGTFQGRRRRAMSVHVTEVDSVIVTDGQTSTETAVTTTTTKEGADATTTTPLLTPGERLPRDLSRGQSFRGRSSSPSLRLKDEDAVALRKEFQEMKKEDEEAEEEEEVLDLPSNEFSLQAGDKSKAPTGKQAAEKKLLTERKTRELKALSELRSVASSAATVFMPKYAYVPQNRRYDDIEFLREKQHHMFRNGILNIVQDWKEDGEFTLPTSFANAQIGNQAGAAQELMAGETGMIDRFKDFVQWDEMGKFGRILYIAMLPISILMYLTVPHPEEEAYNKWLLAVSTALSPLTIFWAFDLFTEEKVWIALVVVLPIFLIFGVLIAIFAKPEPLPRWLHYVFIFWGFVSSMMWIYYTADEVVALLQSLATMIGVSSNIMGLTVLAWGNCIGDFVADITVSNQGYPEMGIAATYGGPLFNLLIGMGLGGTLAALEEGLVSCPLKDMMLVDFVYLIIALIISAIIIPLRKFLVDKIMGAVLLCGYIVFLVLSFLIEFGVFHILPESSSELSSSHSHHVGLFQF